MGKRKVEVERLQDARNTQFTEAMLAGRFDIALIVANADPPEDASEAQRERWLRRRKLYRRLYGPKR